MALAAVWQRRGRRHAGGGSPDPGGGSDPICRGPCPIRRSVRRISFGSGRGSRNPVQVFFGKTGGFPPIRDFLLKIRSRFGNRFLRFFGNFGQKPQKTGKKSGAGRPAAGPRGARIAVFASRFDKQKAVSHRARGRWPGTGPVICSRIEDRAPDSVRQRARIEDRGRGIEDRGALFARC